MNIEEGIRAALATIVKIDDARDLAHIAGPLNDFKENCHYLDFVEPEHNYPFRSETVHVVTRSHGKVSNSVRKLSRHDGREVFNVPPLHLQSAGELSALNVRDPDDSIVQLVAPSLSKTLGTLLCDTVESHVLLALLASSEAQGRVVKTSRESLMEVCDAEVDRLDMPCTVILHFHDVAHIGAHVRLSLGSKGLAKASPTRAIGEGVIMIVGHAPESVGFVTEDDDIRAVVGVEAGFMIRPTAFVKRGFCVWGNAPVVKIDARS